MNIFFIFLLFYSKNPKSGIACTLNKIRTRRRIILTGTPMQNNLKEYFSMVNFCTPNFLG
jgi:SNF2 family DNA or RNA helicase